MATMIPSNLEKFTTEKEGRFYHFLEKVATTTDHNAFRGYQSQSAIQAGVSRWKRFQTRYTQRAAGGWLESPED